MANYLLDTNHAASLVTLGHPLRQRVLASLQAGDTFSVTIPVVTESLFGIGILPRAVQNQAEWERLRLSHPQSFPPRRVLSTGVYWPGLAGRFRVPLK